MPSQSAPVPSAPDRSPVAVARRLMQDDQVPPDRVAINVLNAVVRPLLEELADRLNGLLTALPKTIEELRDYDTVRLAKANFVSWPIERVVHGLLCAPNPAGLGEVEDALVHLSGLIAWLRHDECASVERCCQTTEPFDEAIEVLAEAEAGTVAAIYQARRDFEGNTEEVLNRIEAAE